MPRKPWTEETPHIVAELCEDEFFIEREKNMHTLGVDGARRAINRVYYRKGSLLKNLPGNDKNIEKVLDAYMGETVLED